MARIPSAAAAAAAAARGVADPAPQTPTQPAPKTPPIGHNNVDEDIDLVELFGDYDSGDCDQP